MTQHEDDQSGPITFAGLSINPRTPEERVPEIEHLLRWIAQAMVGLYPTVRPEMQLKLLRVQNAALKALLELMQTCPRCLFEVDHGHAEETQP